MFWRDVLQPVHLIVLVVMLGLFALFVLAIVRLVTGGTRKRCPYCTKRIKKNARVCRYCQREQPV